MRLATAPQAVAHRIDIYFSKYRHALRPRRSERQTLRRALTRASDEDRFLESFRACGDDRFPLGAERAASVVRELDAALPTWRTRTIRAAEEISDGRVRLLGSDHVDARTSPGIDGDGGSLRWHDDIINAYTWKPGTLHKQVPIPYDRADVRAAWELSRCQHIPTLGMAYLASGDERYAAAATSQLGDWIARNPPGYGITWASTMDVAIRVVNWLWAIQLLAGSSHVTDAFLTRFSASLIEHGRHIRRNVSVYEGGITTNHTVADYLALFQLGLVLPEIREAQAWLRTGKDGLVDCMRVQVLTDGVDYENSIPYHRLVLEMFVAGLIFGARAGNPLPETYRASLERMFEFTYHYTRPDGLAPLVGDSDDGRLQVLWDYFGWEPRDHRYLLGVGGLLFRRDDFVSLAANAPGALEEAAWLVGPEAVAQLARSGPPATTRRSRAFPAGGRYVMRHERHYALVATDEVGTNGFGNHKHNDILGYELAVDGVAVVIDAGSYLYLSDRAWRDRFRSTRSHSTLMVDGVEQNRIVDTFRMRHDAHVTVHEWRSEPGVDVLDASHSGYERLDDPVTHRRRISFGKEPFGWLVIDSLACATEHSAESYVHFAPEGVLHALAGETRPSAAELSKRIAELAASIPMEMRFEPQFDLAHEYARDDIRVLIVPLGWQRAVTEEGWTSPRYGRRVRAPMLRLGGALGPSSLAGYAILPCPA